MSARNPAIVFSPLQPACVCFPATVQHNTQSERPNTRTHRVTGTATAMARHFPSRICPSPSMLAAEAALRKELSSLDKVPPDMDIRAGLSSRCIVALLGRNRYSATIDERPRASVPGIQQLKSALSFDRYDGYRRHLYSGLAKKHVFFFFWSLDKSLLYMYGTLAPRVP